ncbi:MAG: gamma-glutamyltransferase family protein [Planctomycetes bacterium]|nr:gamma-glutamyltransferase family protein [Planctomycetota bacterium]
MLDWTFPYPSQRMPVFGRDVVATSQPLAAQAGLSMLQQGGNAVDAAVATAIALTVVEPTANGIGSDAFALLWHEGRLYGLNASGRSPRALTAERYEGVTEMPRLGWDAVTVPGAISAWVELSQRFGRLPLELLFEPAIDYASEGFLVSPQTAEAWARAAARYGDRPEFARHFLPGGRAPRAGELFASDDQAETLEEIAGTAGASFYRGHLADRIVQCAAAEGGVLSREDLAEHACDWVEPLCVECAGLRVHEMPPNGQGIAALIALGVMEHLPAESPDSADAIHLQIEAMKLALADTSRTVADPRAMEIDPAALLDSEYLAAHARLVEPERAADPGYGLDGYSSTVYLAAGDRGGQMVSFIQSNYEGFGSGVVIPGTGIAMQNRGAGFTLRAGHPNRVGGGKRPFHTIIPGFVTRLSNDVEEPVMAFGVMGGPMQPQGHAQVIARIAGYGQNPQAALDAPRWRLTGGRRVLVEPGVDPDVLDDLADRGHEITVAPARTVQHGGGQVVMRLADGYVGASDSRRDGQAVGQ